MGLSFWQHCLTNKNIWDTGIWNKKPESITKETGYSRGDHISIEYVKFMLCLQSSNKVAGIKDIGEDFFLFEEDLSHHINKIIVIIMTGVPTSFFNNYYVWQWLFQLNPKHHPDCKQKLLRLVCIINFVLNKKIDLFMDELYLEYQSSFVALTLVSGGAPYKRHLLLGVLPTLWQIHILLKTDNVFLCQILVNGLKITGNQPQTNVW